VNKYRRIEINAYRRRTTVISGEWNPHEASATQGVETDDGVSLVDRDLGESIASDSPEGQLLLVEAVQSLQSQLSPEARAALWSTPLTPSSRGSPYLVLRPLCNFITGIIGFARRPAGKRPKKQSSEQDSA